MSQNPGPVTVGSVTPHSSNSDIVQCDLGTMQPGDTAVMDITVIPTVAGEVTNYAADTAENEASATVVVI